MAHGAGDDPALLRRAQAGDVDAFAVFVRRYERQLRVVLIRLLDDPRDAEEAVQDAFLQAWRNLGGYRGDAAPFTWLYRIGVNQALARMRRKRLSTTELEAVDQAASASASAHAQPVAEAEAADLRARIVELLRELPGDYREALVLRDVAGLSNQEVANALGVSVAAAKSRIHRARMQLRDLLEPHLEE